MSLRFVLLLVLLLSLCIAQRGSDRSDRGKKKNKKDREEEDRFTPEEEERATKRGAKLPRHKFIFPANPFDSEGPVFRSVTNHSCQMVCRGSFDLSLSGNTEYFRYHRINLTSCFNAPQYAPTSKMIQTHYDASGCNVTRLDASQGVLLSQPGVVYQRHKFGPTGSESMDEFYFDFGVYAPARAMDSRIYVDWEVRRWKWMREGVAGEREMRVCQEQLDEERRGMEEMTRARDGEEEQKRERPHSERWSLDKYEMMEEILPEQRMDGREMGREMMGGRGGEMGGMMEGYSQFGREMERMRERAEENERRMMERFERMVNKQMPVPPREEM